METTWVPIKDIILHWYLTIETSLFPDHFHFRFNPKKILAQFTQDDTLEEKRERYRVATDELIDSALACSTIERLEQLLSETAPMLVAFYYDRVVFGTWWLDNMFPVPQNPSCEIPRDWNIFVSLLLHQQWFA